MQVILREAVENLGRMGDVVQVSDGFARNFLIPHSLAFMADSENIKRFEHQKKQIQKLKALQKESNAQLIQKLQSVTCIISKKVGDLDKVFGSVSTQDIQLALEKQGYKIEKRFILIENPIKTLGLHHVQIRLDGEHTSTIQVSVVRGN